MILVARDGVEPPPPAFSAALLDESHSSKSMTFNEIEVQASFAESFACSTHDGGLFCFLGRFNNFF